MNVEIGTEAAQIPEKEDINGIFVAVHVFVDLNGEHPSAIMYSTVLSIFFLASFFDESHSD